MRGWHARTGVMGSRVDWDSIDLTMPKKIEAARRQRDETYQNFRLTGPRMTDSILESLKHWALEHPLNGTYLCLWARGGWDDADLAAREIIIERMKAQERLPIPFAAYAMELLITTTQIDDL
jgi:hypothetical protein